MSSNDRHAEALAVLKQGGTIPVNNPAVRESLMDWLEAGADGYGITPSRELSTAIRDHNPGIDPHAWTEEGE